MRKQKGFTLVEVVITIMILVVVMAIVGNSANMLGHWTETQKQADRDRHSISILTEAEGYCQQFGAVSGSWETTLDGQTYTVSVNCEQIRDLYRVRAEICNSGQCWQEESYVSAQ